MFLSDNDEFKRASTAVKDKLVSEGKLNENEQPPIKMVLKEARTSIPEKDLLVQSVQAMLKCCCKNDSDLEVKRLELGWLFHRNSKEHLEWNHGTGPN